MFKIKQIKNSALLLLVSALVGCGEGSFTDVNADTDGDGLTNVDETTLYKTNPNVADTDGDGYSDFEEIINRGRSDRNTDHFGPYI